MGNEMFKTLKENWRWNRRTETVEFAPGHGRDIVRVGGTGDPTPVGWQYDGNGNKDYRYVDHEPMFWLFAPFVRSPWL